MRLLLETKAVVSITSKGKEKQKRTEDSEDDDQDPDFRPRDQDSDFRPRKRVTRGSQSTSQLDGVENEDDDEVPEVMDDTEEEAAPVSPRGRPRKTPRDPTPIPAAIEEDGDKENEEEVVEVERSGTLTSAAAMDKLVGKRLFLFCVWLMNNKTTTTDNIVFVGNA